MSSSMYLALLGLVFIPLAMAIILFSNSGKDNKPKQFLSFVMLNTAFVFFGNYLYFTHDFVSYSYLHGFHIASVLLIYPSIFIYLNMLTKSGHFVKTHLYHFIPALLFMILSDVFFFLFLSENERIYFLDKYRYQMSYDNWVLNLLWIIRMTNLMVLFLQIPFYFFQILKLQRKHVERINNSFSNPWHVNLNWIKWVNYLFIVSAFLCVFFYSLNPKKLFGNESVVIYPFYLLAIVISIFGVLGNMQKVIFPDELIDEKESLSGHLLMEEEEVNLELKVKLEKHFLEDKPFLNPDYRIWDLAFNLNSNRTYISSFINTYYNQNFNQFVNKYRIEYASEIKEKYPNMKQEEIAIQAGFGSVSSYLRAHKCFTEQKVNC